LVECLGRNQGPTRLDFCKIDNSVLADGLRGSSRLKVFRALNSNSSENRNREFLAIADAVRENKGLVDLDLRYDFGVSDEAWGAICDSLETHPTIEVLHLCSAFTGAVTKPTVLKSRIQAILDMVKINLSIHTIHLHDRYCLHELFRESVIPYLETNR
jgi:Ran GTPase-activating protein (RanGAP) involved in mRNA processing and transport